jgi:hypothetical protein
MILNLFQAEIPDPIICLPRQLSYYLCHPFLHLTIQFVESDRKTNFVFQIKCILPVLHVVLKKNLSLTS